MAESGVILPVDSAGKALRTQTATTTFTTGVGGVVHQQVVSNAIDVGRSAVVLSSVAVASVTTEALLSMSIWKAGVVTTGTSYTVTAGKTLRVQAIQFGTRFTTPSTTQTFANTRFNLRAIASGTLSATSALVYGDTKLAVSNTPTPNSDLTVPEGLEFPSGFVVGVSHVASAATLLNDVVIVGYEY